MTVMRLLLGKLLRTISFRSIMIFSFIFLFISLFLFSFAGYLYTATPGLVLLGAGLAAGFPVMLGITGDRFKELSGTAFSCVMTVALTGNMLVNYMMGLMAGKYGISNLIIVAFAEMSLQIILFVVIIRSLKLNLK